MATMLLFRITREAGVNRAMALKADSFKDFEDIERRSKIMDTEVGQHAGTMLSRAKQR